MNWGVIAELVAILAPLSLVAIGGAQTMIADVHRQVVEVHGWLTETQFAELYALAQVAPGPNILVVSLIGWKVAGVPGAVAALAAACGPPSLLAFAVSSLWRRRRLAVWLSTVQAGLAPIAIGLVLASGLVVGSAVSASPRGLLLTAAAVVLLLRTRIHPLALMAAGAALAALGWL